MGVKLDGAKVVFVILGNFHQAVRVAAIVTVLKHGWLLIVYVRYLKSECLYKVFVLYLTM